MAPELQEVLIDRAEVINDLFEFGMYFVPRDKFLDHLVAHGHLVLRDFLDVLKVRLSIVKLPEEFFEIFVYPIDVFLASVGISVKSFELSNLGVQVILHEAQSYFTVDHFLFNTAGTLSF